MPHQTAVNALARFLRFPQECLSRVAIGKSSCWNSEPHPPLLPLPDGDKSAHPAISRRRDRVFKSLLTCLVEPFASPYDGFPMKPNAKKREARRMIRRQSAWITLNGEAASECLIMDISKKGAKIVPDGSSVVPTRFELAFASKDHKRQACEVVWRRGRMVGIKFIS
jgi:hypothetical protein